MVKSIVKYIIKSIVPVTDTRIIDPAAIINAGIKFNFMSVFNLSLNSFKIDPGCL